MSERQIARLDFSAQAVGKMRNEVTVTASFGGEWGMATDEGPFHGGDDSAPPPLAYFATALAGCIMTQVRAFAKRLDIHITALSSTGWVEWWLEPGPQRTYRSGATEFGVELVCESPASNDKLVELVNAAKRGCFVEQSLVNAVPIHHRLVHNGSTTEID